MATSSVKLTLAEAMGLVAALHAEIGISAAAAALVEAVGKDRATELIRTRKGAKWGKADTIALVKALYPRIPGATAKEKTLIVVRVARQVFDADARFEEVMDYVFAKLKAYAAAGTATAVSSDYPAVGNKTVTGYGPVNNHWKIPDTTIVQILDQMQRSNVRAYKVECVGHASEDVLGTEKKLEQAKTKILFAASECAKRGIFYHATMFNDNAGKSTWKNGGPSLGERLAQAKAFIDWFAGTVPPNGVYVVLVGETRTAAGKELEKYGAEKLKAAGFKIGNNDGSRPQATASFGGIQTDFNEYHPTKTTDWPASKRTHVTSDTGAILAQLNQGGNVYGLGDPAKVAAWRAEAVKKGYDFAIYYGFDAAEYDGETIAAMSAVTETASASSAAEETWSGIPAGTVFLHGDVSAWPETTTLKASVSKGGTVTLDYDKAKVWKAVDGVNANPWVIVKWTDGKWYAATWEWLRFGQTSKDMGGKSWGGHIKRTPLSSWEPSSGETVYFMVSGLARDKTRNAQERSDPVKIVWP